MSERRTPLCIHGHFYQPPRENPWLEAIELQESAAPAHDWNERIHRECYLPNARARVVDSQGALVDIVNNFESLSFNFGPTLLAWLEHAHPETYERVLEADRLSVKARGGHGNAIAQVYNHMIMPLANLRDKVTQVRWGVEDFRHRFGRDPESIWLAETAVNEETLEVLVDAGMKYVILEPHQAQRVRPLGGGEWRDVASGDLDPRKAYRCRLRRDPSKHIDVFFYDGPISKAAGFEDLLFDAKRFADRIDGARGEGECSLVNLATDGETYGHHKAYGDRVLAYLLTVEAPARGYRLTNYGEHLEQCPPVQEVELKEGDNGEGTSWSCAHGVRRWKDHCGCRGGGPGDWNQNWRKPLRDALDWLRDELAPFFEKECGKYLQDPWAARDAYARVILDRGQAQVAAFFEAHARRALAPEERTACLKLLEMQRHAMLMYTSCGWFFTELSGIETVQVILYAARAVQLAAETGAERLEAPFLERLALAKSNVPEYGDGRGVYEKLVRPSVVSLPRILGYYAIGSTFENYYEDEKRPRIYCFDLDVEYQRRETLNGVTLNFGRVRVRSRVTSEESDLVFAAVQRAPYDFRSWIRPFSGDEEFRGREKALFDGLRELDTLELSRRLESVLGREYYTLKDLLFEDRLRVLSILTGEMREKANALYDTLFEENQKINDIHRSLGLPIPREMSHVARLTLGRRLAGSVRELARHGFDPARAQIVFHFLETAAAYGLDLDLSPVSAFLKAELESRLERLDGAEFGAAARECLDLLALAERLGVAIDLTESQDLVFALARKWREDGRPAGLEGTEGEAFFGLLAKLRVNADELRKTLERVAEPAAA